MEILLRPLCIQDAVPLAKMADNENVHRYLRDRFPSPYLPEHALSFIQCCREILAGTDDHIPVEFLGRTGYLAKERLPGQFVRKDGGFGNIMYTPERVRRG